MVLLSRCHYLYALRSRALSSLASRSPQRQYRCSSHLPHAHTHAHVMLERFVFVSTRFSKELNGHWPVHILTPGFRSIVAAHVPCITRCAMMCHNMMTQTRSQALVKPSFPVRSKTVISLCISCWWPCTVKSIHSELNHLHFSGVRFFLFISTCTLP